MKKVQSREVKVTPELYAQKLSKRQGPTHALYIAEMSVRSMELGSPEMSNYAKNLSFWKNVVGYLKKRQPAKSAA